MHQQHSYYRIEGGDDDDDDVLILGQQQQQPGPGSNSQPSKRHHQSIVVTKPQPQTPNLEGSVQDSTNPKPLLANPRPLLQTSAPPLSKAAQYTKTIYENARNVRRRLDDFSDTFIPMYQERSRVWNTSMKALPISEFRIKKINTGAAGDNKHTVSSCCGVLVNDCEFLGDDALYYICLHISVGVEKLISCYPHPSPITNDHNGPPLWDTKNIQKRRISR